MFVLLRGHNADLWRPQTRGLEELGGIHNLQVKRARIAAQAVAWRAVDLLLAAGGSISARGRDGRADAAYSRRAHRESAQRVRRPDAGHADRARSRAIDGAFPAHSVARELFLHPKPAVHPHNP